MAIKNIPDVYASNKILDTNEAKRKISEIKSKNKTVGLCHGGFDLLHSGHIKHFESAKKICDYLFVSVTSDRFVSLLKGKVRPIFPDKLRAYSIASIQFVDYVLIADFKLGVEVINILKPSYYIKGPDYMSKHDPDINAERDAIRFVGGEIMYTTEPKLSTSEIIKYIKENL
ncbi:adenylyltransferase/cytidyltransferase family protein [Candidatus Woesearchaeota archaeon]|nr:adenylyltransferase/cytidyltransferase family protein [Candidatus Woesearchaeota archaeon]